MHNPDPRKIGLQFIRDDKGKARLDALPHFLPLRGQRHLPGIVDRDEQARIITPPVRVSIGPIDRCGARCERSSGKTD